MSDPTSRDDERQAAPTQRSALSMSLRDYFAAQALAGIMANTIMTEAAAMTFITQPLNVAADAYAETAYVVADAMLKARKQS